MHHSLIVVEFALWDQEHTCVRCPRVQQKKPSAPYCRYLHCSVRQSTHRGASGTCASMGMLLSWGLEVSCSPVTEAPSSPLLPVPNILVFNSLWGLVSPYLAHCAFQISASSISTKFIWESFSSEWVMVKREWTLEAAKQGLNLATEEWTHRLI